jgi:hypothetical protein
VNSSLGHIVIRSRSIEDHALDVMLTPHADLAAGCFVKLGVAAATLREHRCEVSIMARTN